MVGIIYGHGRFKLHIRVGISDALLVRQGFEVVNDVDLPSDRCKPLLSFAFSMFLVSWLVTLFSEPSTAHIRESNLVWRVRTTLSFHSAVG